MKITITIANSIELSEMSTSVENLIISPNSCNELKSLNLNKYRYLKSIEIGNECFMYVDTFNIDGLNELKSLKIGINSFTKKKNSYGKNTSRSFHLINCDELESIDIGRYSFSDYAGEFELKNLPKLSTIKIGEIGSGSRNFHELPVFMLQGSRIV